jgi:arylsulfatase A-like enzyme
MCDDLGYGDTGFNGHPRIQTPHLDRMASEGMRLNRFYAGGPVCSPTRGTCLTGRHYIRYGINHANQGRLPEGERTLPQILREHGYKTGHFGKWHLGTLDKQHSCKSHRDPATHFAPPWQRGYDASFATEIAVPLWNPQQNFDLQTQERLPGHWISPYYRQGEQVTDQLTGCDSAIIMDEVLPFISETVAREQPFFTTIWFHATHTPVEAGPEWLARYQDCDPDAAHFYGCVSAMDAQVGRLLHHLRSLGIADNCQTWFCSDNGPEGNGLYRPGNRSVGSTGGLRGRKRSLYNGGLTVPAICHWPGTVTAGSESNVPCSTLDYLPTLLSSLNIPMQEAIGDDRAIDGVDLNQVIRGHQQRRDHPIPFRFLSPQKSMAGSPTFAVMNDDYKFLTNLGENHFHDQWYLPAKDPGEQINVIADFADEAQSARQYLTDFLASCRASHAGGDYAFDPITAFQEPSEWT